MRVSVNGCPSEQDNEDILVDVLGLLSSEFGVVPLGLARSYAATSCEEVARASPHSKTGLYWITDGSNTAHQEHCTPGTLQLLSGTIAMILMQLLYSSA